MAKKRKGQDLDHADAKASWQDAAAVVRDELTDYRKSVPNGDKLVAYTLKQHRALRHMLTLNLALTYAFVRELRDRIDQLEARPQLKHAGVWREGKTFKAANLVTHAGSMWLAKRNTKARPGQSDHWQLVVKSGQAA